MSEIRGIQKPLSPIRKNQHDKGPRKSEVRFQVSLIFRQAHLCLSRLIRGAGTVRIAFFICKSTNIIEKVPCQVNGAGFVHIWVSCTIQPRTWGFHRVKTTVSIPSFPIPPTFPTSRAFACEDPTISVRFIRMAELLTGHQRLALHQLYLADHQN